MFAVTSTLVHLKLKHLPIPPWSDHTSNMHLPHGSHSQPETLPNLIKSNADLHASPKTTTNGPSQSHNSPLNSVGNHLINAERMLAMTLFYKSRLFTVQIQFRFIIYDSPRDIPDNVEPTHLPRFPLAQMSINTRTSPELLSTGMLFLTQPVQHHLLIPSEQSLHRLSTSPSNSHC